MVAPAVNSGKKKRPAPPTSGAGTDASDGDPLVSPRKRTKSPGAVHRGRIYDSKNGKTCHQCRQKTIAFSASCRNDHGGKQCPIHFCHACLLNRYGEKAEEAVAADAWSCPKCRGICNCSICMKKRGQPPTGILAPIARSSGFSSVSEMLLQQQRAETAGSAGSSADNPIDVDELLEEQRRRAEQRDREIETLKAEIAVLRAAIEEAEKVGEAW
ncbi:hypothetical protein Taro_007758 [Colocasia esculenta]|uniref:Zinc-finger domain-containing protein n=1 Tax=Colocasia esculenta TaxID=4460 RepID=A0A843U1A2_COLES|nr:hypothetical protein [Colocasia esculenta]